MRIGIFGGTFDPPHIGHLILAEFVRDEIGLDKIWLVPALEPPHKLDREKTPRLFNPIIRYFLNISLQSFQVVNSATESSPIISTNSF